MRTETVDRASDLSVTSDDEQNYPTQVDATLIGVALAVGLGAFMALLDATIVGIALPKFTEVFSATYAQVAWTMMSYTLALAAAVPVTGWATDRIGSRRLFLIALVLFVIGSGLCALAPNLLTLVVARFIQGAGGGMIAPVGMTIVVRAAGPKRIGKLIAILGAPLLLGPVLGPVVGGWLIGVASWEWIFLINLPIGIVAIVLGWWVLPDDDESAGERFDVLGWVLFVPSLGLMLLAATHASEGDGMTPLSIGLFAVGLVLLAGFLLWALRGPIQPALIDLQLFRNRQFTVAVIGLCLFGAGFFGTGLLLPDFFVNVRGLNTTDAGKILIAQGLGVLISLPVAGFLTDHVKPGYVAIVGVIGVTAGLAVFAVADDNTSNGVLIAALVVLGAGVGAALTPLNTAALSVLNEVDIPRGSTIVNIAQQGAGAVGAAVLTGALTIGREDGVLAGSHLAFAVAVGVMVTCLVPTLFVRGRVGANLPGPMG